MEKSPGLLLVSMNIDPVLEPEFHRWYEEEHLPERLAVPGFLRVRRFEAVQGAPKHLTLYDLAEPDVLLSEAYKRLKGQGQSAWTTRMLSHSTDFHRAVYRQISDRTR